MVGAGRAPGAATPRRSAASTRRTSGSSTALGRVDDELHAWRALDALRAQPGRWGNDPVFFYGFDDLTALERDAVETLARVAGAEVTVSLTYEPGREALVARAETVEELRPLAQRVAGAPPRRTRYYAPQSRAALHHLERHLFSGETAEAERIDPGDAVVLLEAGGERAEAELVAQRALGLLRDGVPADGDRVVYRSRASAAGAAAARCSRSTGSRSPPATLRRSATPRWAAALLAAARCALPPTEARADDLLAYLRTPGLLQTPEIADGLEADIRRARPADRGPGARAARLGARGARRRWRGARTPAPRPLPAGPPPARCPAPAGGAGARRPPRRSTLERCAPSSAAVDELAELGLTPPRQRS